MYLPNPKLKTLTGLYSWVYQFELLKDFYTPKAGLLMDHDVSLT